MGQFGSHRTARAKFPIFGPAGCSGHSDASRSDLLFDRGAEIIAGRKFFVADLGTPGSGAGLHRDRIRRRRVGPTSPAVMIAVCAILFLTMNKKNRQQVFRNIRRSWSVKSYGASRAIKVFDTQREAISWAKSKCKEQGLELYVHGRDGSVRFTHSYTKNSAT
jgi:Uncharacterized protein conserved in bacteria (DUF2188)